MFVLLLLHVLYSAAPPPYTRSRSLPPSSPKQITICLQPLRRTPQLFWLQLRIYLYQTMWRAGASDWRLSSSSRVSHGLPAWAPHSLGLMDELTQTFTGWCVTFAQKRKEAMKTRTESRTADSARGRDEEQQVAHLLTVGRLWELHESCIQTSSQLLEKKQTTKKENRSGFLPESSEELKRDRGGLGGAGGAVSFVFYQIKIILKKKKKKQRALTCRNDISPDRKESEASTWRWARSRGGGAVREKGPHPLQRGFNRACHTSLPGLTQEKQTHTHTAFVHTQYACVTPHGMVSAANTPVRVSTKLVSHHPLCPAEMKRLGLETFHSQLQNDVSCSRWCSEYKLRMTRSYYHTSIYLKMCTFDRIISAFCAGYVQLAVVALWFVSYFANRQSHRQKKTKTFWP